MSINIYQELVQGLDQKLLESQRGSRKSDKNIINDEFQILAKKIKELKQSVSDNNRQILRLKDKLITNAKKQKQAELCIQIKGLCDNNYQLITQMRQNMISINQIIEKNRIQFPDQPETFAKVYRKQHLSQQMDEILKQSFTIQKLVQRFSFQTTLKRIRLVLPDISQQEVQKLAVDNEGFSQATQMKLTGKASLKLKYAHTDYLAKQKEIKMLQSSIQQNLKLMKQVSILVHKQGQMIDDIFKNVSKAKNYVTKGLKVLEEEQDQHKKRRRKICCIISLLILILAAFAIPVIITQIHKNSSSSQSTTEQNSDSPS